MKEQIVEKSQDRLAILDEIAKLEKEGRFDVDPEKDPPTIVLTPDNVDKWNRKFRKSSNRSNANMQSL